VYGTPPAAPPAPSPVGARAYAAATAVPTPAGTHRSDGHGYSYRFRADVEGLRAVAILLVLIYHAGVPFFTSGYVGVDVFFVISGFLITTQLVSELDRTGRISLVAFYARRAKRLLPAAGIVLAATVLLVRPFVPKVRWEEIGGDILASALYVVNWRLADRSVDYLAEDSQPSPVQHFWSLAVEEQFYLIWPLLILLAALAGGLIGGRTRPTLWVALAAVGVPSFLWAVAASASNPAWSFFVTTTRMWELALGAAVALAARGFARLPRGPSVAVGWAGLAVITASAVLFSTRTPWPGMAALLPTVGTAAVIATGVAAGPNGPVALLGTAPFQWVGGLSYSLYLWHWPLLVAATAYWNGLSVLVGIAVVLFSVVPAWLTYHLVENRLRYSRAISGSPRLALSMGANFSLLGVVAGLFLLLGVPAPTPAPTRVYGLGAAVLGPDPRDDPRGLAPDRVDFITPDPLAATADVPDVYKDKCHQTQADPKLLSCVYGNPQSSVRVVVAGDSKAAQWLPALQLLAAQNDWKLIVYTKSSCSFAWAIIVDGEGKPYKSCQQWNEALLDRLVNVDKPAFVITSQTAREAIDADGKRSAEQMVRGLRASWAAVAAAGAKVIVIADNPSPGLNVYECVDEHRDNLSACTYSRDVRAANGAYTTQVEAVQGQAGVTMIDLFDAICPTARCSPVIGNVLVYRQGAHITATYVKTLTPRLATALTAAGLSASFDPAR